MPSRDEILGNADYLDDDAGLMEHAAQALVRRGAPSVAERLRVRRDEWREQAAVMRRRVKQRDADFTAAHAEGLHDEFKREFCPDCEAIR